MQQKDLAEEYLDKKIKQEPFKSLTKGFKYIFSAEDIKEAFNAGIENVIDKASELEWKDISLYGEKARYVNVCRANKPLEEYIIQKWFCPKGIELHGNDFVKNGFKNIEEAKAYANKHYKKRIKQVLGL